VRYNRTRTRRTPFTNPNRRAQHGVAADERAVANVCPVLRPPIKIARHYSRANIDTLANLGVAHVAEVVHLTSGAKRRSFDLGVRPNASPPSDSAPGPDMRVRANHNLVLQSGLTDGGR
jgi:hypothetical protein